VIRAPRDPRQIGRCQGYLADDEQTAVASRETPAELVNKRHDQTKAISTKVKRLQAREAEAPRKVDRNTMMSALRR
jgi:hypothetical protein